METQPYLIVLALLVPVACRGGPPMGPDGDRVDGASPDAGALMWRDDDEAQAKLRAVAEDPTAAVRARRDALAGLAHSAGSSADTRRLLACLAAPGGPPELRADALRAGRGHLGHDLAAALVEELWAEARARPDGPGGPVPDGFAERAEQILLAFGDRADALSKSDRQRVASLVPARPGAAAEWERAAPARGADADAGRRLFALATGPRCYTCHTIDGRGGNVGPDLTGLGARMERAAIVRSIVEPAREVAPSFAAVRVELKDGASFTGVNQPEPGSALVTIVEPTGRLHKIRPQDVRWLRPARPASVMPEGLVDRMTVAEFRDLVAYLASPR